MISICWLKRYSGPHNAVIYKTTHVSTAAMIQSWSCTTEVCKSELRKVLAASLGEIEGGASWRGEIKGLIRKLKKDFFEKCKEEEEEWCSVLSYKESTVACFNWQHSQRGEAVSVTTARGERSHRQWAWWTLELMDLKNTFKDDWLKEKKAEIVADMWTPNS